MRKVILQEFVSVDGMAAGPNGSVEFVPECTRGDRGFGKHQLEFAKRIDTILLGRVTYQMFASYWPTATDDPAADMLNNTPKIVFSKTLERAPWGSYAETTSGAARSRRAWPQGLAWSQHANARSLTR
jgi:dihydrofolate reductase